MTTKFKHATWILLVIAVTLVKSDDDSILAFNLKLTNVDSSSAEFEVLDNNSTTITYKIGYKLTSNSSAADHKTEVFISTEFSFEMQTNSATLLAEQQKLLSDDDSADVLKQSMHKDDRGVIYTSDFINRIHSKTYEEIHRFIVPDLDPNR